MKKFLTIAAVFAVLGAVPALANDNMTTEQKDAKATAAIAKADTDKDGKLSKAEWATKSDQAFAEADTNSDGFVTKEEKLAYMEKKWAKK